MATALPNLSFSLGSMWTRAVVFIEALRRKRPAKQLRVRETLSLGDKRQLFIVECGSRRLLIGATGSSMATLAELRDEPATESEGRE